jgi:chromosome segregation ATPase|eukprot:g11869.t1
MRATIIICIVILCATAGITNAAKSLSTIQEELNSLVQAPSGSVPAPTVGDSKKIASPKESLLLLDGISKEVSSEMEFREKERGLMEARCMKKKMFFEKELQVYSGTIKESQIRLKELMPRLHKLEGERDTLNQHIKQAEDRIASLVDGIAAVKDELADAEALRAEDMGHFHMRSKAWRKSMKIVRLIMDSVKRATAQNKGPRAVTESTEKLDAELRATAKPLAATNATTASFLEQWSKLMDTPEQEADAKQNIDEATKTSDVASTDSGEDEDTSSKNQTKPAHKIIAMLNKIHDHFTAAHGTEGEREKQAHFAHKRLVEKLKLSMNTKKGHLHTIQQLKRKISRDAKEIKKKLEELNKLSDDLNFNMDHAREGMAKARHHLEQHLAMCESLEENFNTFKLNLKDVVTQINDIRKVMEERMLAATKTLEKILGSTMK